MASDMVRELIEAAYKEGFQAGDFSRRRKNVGEHGGTWRDSWDGSCAKDDAASLAALEDAISVAYKCLGFAADIYDGRLDGTGKKKGARDV